MDDIIPAYGEAGPEADAMNHPAPPAPPPTGPADAKGTTETDVEANRKAAEDRRQALASKS